MNTSLVILWVILGLLILSSIIGLIFYAYNVFYSSDNDIINPKPQCSSLTSTLPNITNQECCQGLGNVKYNSDILVNMAPEPVNYQSVCRQFCNGDYNTSTDVCSNDIQANIDLVNNCVAAMKPVNCLGPALPLALSGSTLYYGIQANLNGCNTVPCI